MKLMHCYGRWRCYSCLCCLCWVFLTLTTRTISALVPTFGRTLVQRAGAMSMDLHGYHRRRLNRSIKNVQSSNLRIGVARSARIGESDALDSSNATSSSDFDPLVNSAATAAAAPFNATKYTANSSSALAKTTTDLQRKDWRQTLGLTLPNERYVFSEYTSGNVSRLFSTLEYNVINDTMSIQATHAAGSVPAAMALVTGTTVGAGVLALPSATAEAGFVPSTVALLVGYAIMTISGLLLAELVLNRLGQTGRPSTTGILNLYTSDSDESSSPSSFSMVSSTVSTLAYFFLHYALMVAYIAQGGVLVSQVLATAQLPLLESGSIDAMAASASLGSILFATSMAVVLYTATKATMQSINNALVIGVFATFAATVGYGASTAEYASALIDPSNQHVDQIASAMPVVFLAFVYQNIVPVIVKDLEGDRTKIVQAIIGGTTIPLVMFVAWNAVILAHIAPGTDVSNVNPVALLQGSGDSETAILSNLVSSFSILAIITSLIGFVYGLLDAWTDVLKLSASTVSSYKVPLFGIIFGPPLFLALANPNVFQTALEYGGAFGVSTLFMVIPPLLVWKERYGDYNDDSAAITTVPLMTPPLVPLGKIPLVLLWLAAAIVIVEQATEKLPGLRDTLLAS